MERKHRVRFTHALKARSYCVSCQLETNGWSVPAVGEMVPWATWLQMFPGRPKMIYLLNKWLVKMQQNSPKVSSWACLLNTYPASYCSWTIVPFNWHDRKLPHTSELVFPAWKPPPGKCDTHIVGQEVFSACGAPFCNPVGSLSYSKLTHLLWVDFSPRFFIPQNLCWFFPRRPLVTSVHMQARLGFRVGSRGSEPALLGTELVTSLAQGSNQLSHQARTSFKALKW